MYDFNLIKLIWTKIKRFIRKNNKAIFNDLENLTYFGRYFNYFSENSKY